MWHRIEGSQYHVVETASGRLTNLSLVLLKHSVVSMWLVRSNVSFSFFLPLDSATRDVSSVEMFPRRH